MAWTGPVVGSGTGAGLAEKAGGMDAMAGAVLRAVVRGVDGFAAAGGEIFSSVQPGLDAGQRFCRAARRLGADGQSGRVDLRVLAAVVYRFV